MNKYIILLIAICLYSCKDNVHKEYYETGELKEVFEMEGGKLNGERKVYFKNGTLNWHAVYKDNKVNGFFKEYNEKGILIASTFFKNGIGDGIQKTYFDDGSILKEAKFVNGKSDGIYKEYFNNGKLKKIACFDHGTFLFSKKYDQEGKLVNWIGEIEIKSLTEDTLFEGETYKAAIEFLGTYEGEKIVFSAAIAPLLRYIQVLPSKENRAQIETPPLPPGPYVVKIYVNVIGLSTEITMRKEILVLPKSKKSNGLKHSS